MKFFMQNQDNRYLTFNDIDRVGQTAINRTFRDIGQNAPIIEGSKGGLGVYIEEHLYNYHANNDDNPDFIEAGVELKVTPYKAIYGGKNYSAKERLVLNIINFEEEYLKEFETSKFWHKNKNLYMMFYEYIKGLDRLDLTIHYAMLYDYPEEDLIIIKQDWELIIDKIRRGLAHTLSEGDTMYLGACPKGKDSKSLRTQPCSNIMAMQRAYCLKQSYMTSVVRNIVIPGIKRNNLVSASELHILKFEDIIKLKFEPFKDVSEDELLSRFNIPNTKNKFELISRKILGIKGKISNTDEFQKANIIVKCIRRLYNGRIEQSVSFPTFDYCELVEESDWDESTLKQQFENQKFMFIVFKEIEPNSNKYSFEKIVMWNMPLETLNSNVYKVWKKTKEVVASGNIVKSIVNGKRITNFPGMSEDEVCHVRPHGQNAADTNPLPVTDKVTGLNEYTKHCFWLNNTYIVKIINEN